MKSKSLLWLLTLVFVIGAFIDVIDGYFPKLVSSLSITLALLCFAIAGSKTGSKLHVVGYTFLFVAFMAFVYRLLKHYHVV